MPYTLGLQADVVAAFVAELGLDTLALLTHDVGDTVGGELLARRPEGRWAGRGHPPGGHQRQHLHRTGPPDQRPAVPPQPARREAAARGPHRRRLADPQPARRPSAPTPSLAPDGLGGTTLLGHGGADLRDDGHRSCPASSATSRSAGRPGALHRRHRADPSPLHIVWGRTTRSPSPPWSTRCSRPGPTPRSSASTGSGTTPWSKRRRPALVPLAPEPGRLSGPGLRAGRPLDPTPASGAGPLHGLVSSSSKASRSAVPEADSTRWASNMVRGASADKSPGRHFGVKSSCVSAGNADVAPLSGEQPPGAAHALFRPLAADLTRPPPLGVPTPPPWPAGRIVVQPLATRMRTSPRAINNHRPSESAAALVMTARSPPPCAGRPRRPRRPVLDQDHPEFANRRRVSPAVQGPIAWLEDMEGNLARAGTGPRKGGTYRGVRGWGVRTRSLSPHCHPRR